MSESAANPRFDQFTGSPRAVARAFVFGSTGFATVGLSPSPNFVGDDGAALFLTPEIVALQPSPLATPPDAGLVFPMSALHASQGAALVAFPAGALGPAVPLQLWRKTELTEAGLPAWVKLGAAFTANPAALTLIAFASHTDVFMQVTATTGLSGAKPVRFALGIV